MEGRARSREETMAEHPNFPFRDWIVCRIFNLLLSPKVLAIFSSCLKFKGPVYILINVNIWIGSRPRAVDLTESIIDPIVQGFGGGGIPSPSPRVQGFAPPLREHGAGLAFP